MNGDTVSGNFDNPLVIFCSSRTGSSMVMGMFANLGFWVGNFNGLKTINLKTIEARNNNRINGNMEQTPYPSYENARIKRWIKMHYPLDLGNHRGNWQRSDLRDFCRIVVPDGQPWVVKALSEYHGLWQHYFPRMTAAFLFRDEKQAIEAHVRRQGERVRRIVTYVVSERYKYMRRELMRNTGGFRIDAEKIIEEDFSQIEPIVAKYGLDFDHRLAAKDIIPPIFTR